MKNLWHEQIQRYLNGQSSAEEAAALHEAFNENAELRALYVDYANLDVALGVAAENALFTGDKPGRSVSFPPSRPRMSSPAWRWLAAAAACAV